jgi:hypothetical protein
MEAKQTKESMTTIMTATGHRPQTGTTPGTAPRTKRAAVCRGKVPTINH